MTTLATYWSMTINNPDDNDAVLVRNPNDKYIRQLVWTVEEGEDGTEHVQGWVRLHRNNSMAFVKKLYPRAHLKPITKDEYNENCHDYAQKDDDTTRGAHVISLNDPLPAVDTILYRVLERVYERMDADQKLAGLLVNDMLRLTHQVEDEMVSDRAGLEKLFISGTYDKMKRRFYNQIISRLITKHADDNERQGSGESEVHEAESISGSDYEEEELEESSCETDEGFDSGGESDCQEEGGDEAFD